MLKSLVVAGIGGDFFRRYFIQIFVAVLKLFFSFGKYNVPLNVAEQTISYVEMNYGCDYEALDATMRQKLAKFSFDRTSTKTVQVYRSSRYNPVNSLESVFTRWKIFLKVVWVLRYSGTLILCSRVGREKKTGEESQIL